MVILFSIVSPLYFYGYIFIILIVTYAFFNSLIKFIPLDFKLKKISYIFSKILLIIGLFFIIDNVFVMRIGYKNCSTCLKMTKKGIIFNSFLLSIYVFYIVYLILFCDLKK